MIADHKVNILGEENGLELDVNEAYVELFRFKTIGDTAGLHNYINGYVRSEVNRKVDTKDHPYSITKDVLNSFDAFCAAADYYVKDSVKIDRFKGNEEVLKQRKQLTHNALQVGRMIFKHMKPVEGGIREFYEGAMNHHPDMADEYVNSITSH